MSFEEHTIQPVISVILGVKQFYYLKPVQVSSSPTIMSSEDLFCKSCSKYQPEEATRIVKGASPLP